MFVLGLDIGYSNLKVAFGESGKEPSRQIVPSGAAPEDRIPQGIRLSENGIKVMMGDEAWRIGLSHVSFDQWTRSLHSEYSDTPAYGALYYGAMAMTGKSTIDKVVTGLPVSLWGDPRIRDGLAARMKGTHQVRDDLEVRVRTVEVIPQPLGAFINAYWQSGQDAKLLSEGRILVIDPGFFSVDWVVIESGGLRKSGSGTSLNAMSVLLKETSRLIHADLDGILTVERIEEVLRSGKNETYLYGKPLNLAPYLEQASSTIAKLAIEELKESTRREVGSVDVVVLAGGGGHQFRDAVQSVFTKSRLFVDQQPALANAKGFYYYGEM